MKTIIMIALIAMSFSCTKQEIETEPKSSDIFVGDSISQTLTPSDTVYLASSNEWLVGDTTYSIDIKYFKHVNFLQIKINCDKFETTNGLVDGYFYFEDKDKYVLLLATDYWLRVNPKFDLGYFLRYNLNKVTYGRDASKPMDIKLPKEMSGIFIEFFKKVDEYEDKN